MSARVACQPVTKWAIGRSHRPPPRRLQYQSTTSKYNSWTQEVGMEEGSGTGTTLEIESRADSRYADGVVVLNLSSTQSTQPWAALRSRATGALLAEERLGVIPPGGKLRAILSDMFPFQPDAVYSVETRSNQPIQALGLSFFGSDFFAPIPVAKP